eukprot:gene9229-16376_t
MAAGAELVVVTVPAVDLSRDADVSVAYQTVGTACQAAGNANPVFSGTPPGALTLECLAPPKKAGSYKVIVTNVDSGYSVTTHEITYQSGAPPVVASLVLVVQGNYLAGGDEITITGTVFADGSTVTVGGTACRATGDANPCFSDTPSAALNLKCLAPPKDAGSYVVVVTNVDSGYSETTHVITYQSEVLPATQFLASGSTLTITGSTFVSAVEGLSVKVGDGVCSSVTFVSDTSITCVAPAVEGGTYNIVVTNPDTGFSVETAAFAGVDTVSIGGTPCTGVNVDSSTSITCVAPRKAAGSYAVTVTDVNLCVSTSVKVADTNVCQVATGYRCDGNSADTTTCTALTCATGYTASTAPALVETLASCASAGANWAPSQGTCVGTPPTVTAVTPIIQPQFLLGGDTLIITGTLFVTGATVSIGGTACSDVTLVHFVRNSW